LGCPAMRIGVRIRDEGSGRFLLYRYCTRFSFVLLIFGMTLEPNVLLPHLKANPRPSAKGTNHTAAIALEPPINGVGASTC
jgi:hypothetical protein